MGLIKIYVEFEAYAGLKKGPGFKVCIGFM